MFRNKTSFSFNIFLIFFICLTIACQPETEIVEPIDEPIDYVNPFIGTGAGGNTFPGAARPFGMVQLSPINGGSPVVDPEGGYAYIGNKGYDYTKDEIIAFTHTSLSGTGTGHLSKYSNIGFMPTVGSIQIDPGTEGSPETGYRSHFLRENQEAHSGYYRVLLEDYSVNVELTATERVGVHRYTYPRSENANVIIDITQERSVIKEASVEIIDNNTIAGHTTDIGRWISNEQRWMPDPETPTTWYFYSEFSKPFDSYGTFSSHEILQNERVASGNEEVGAFVTYDTESEEEVVVNVGISFSSLEGAKRNLREEVTGWDFDVQKAYEATRKNAFEPGPRDRARDGLDFYMESGYIAADQIRESVSKTLEDAHTDWALALFAKDLGHTEDYERLKERAYNYQNLYDPSTGYFLPRLTDGSWLPECEPGEQPDLVRSDITNYFGEYRVYHDCFDPWWVGTIPYLHYTESNAHQYLFYVPHDIQGLIELTGGRKEFVDRLDELFTASSAISGPWWSDWEGAIGQYIHGNEPSHHIAYMYNWAGVPWKAQDRIWEIMETKYKTDYRGLPGNDDMGQMSAWFVFSALGFYPVTPGVPEYIIGTPLFERAEIKLDDYYDHATFTVIAHNNSADNRFIQSATLNGEPFERTFITHEEIVSGGILEFEMGSYPNYEWVAAPELAPSSMSR